MADTKTRAGRLVHLAVDQDRLFQHPRLLHRAVHLLGLAHALTDAAKQADPRILLGHVVDQLIDQHRLADAGAAKHPRFAAAFQWGQQIDGLDPGFKHLGAGGAIGQRQERPMDGPVILGIDRVTAIHRITEHIEHTPEQCLTHRHLQRDTHIFYRHSPTQTACSV